MREEWPCRCPGCGVALIVDAPFNLLTNWQQILDRYGFSRVAVMGNWEKLGLENTVPIDSSEAPFCDAIYLGDLINSGISCPRCHTFVYDVILHLSRNKKRWFRIWILSRLRSQEN